MPPESNPLLHASHRNSSPRMQAIRTSVPDAIVKFKIGKANVELDAAFICIAKKVYLDLWTLGFII